MPNKRGLELDRLKSFSFQFNLEALTVYFRWPSQSAVSSFTAFSCNFFALLRNVAVTMECAHFETKFCLLATGTGLISIIGSCIFRPQTNEESINTLSVYDVEKNPVGQS